MTQTKNLWGDIPTPENLPVLPKVILKQQATLLTQTTSGILLGEVIQQKQSGRSFSANLRVKVPILNNYTFDILNIAYPIHLYPLSVTDLASGTQKTVCHTYDEYTQTLENILSSEQVKTVVATLLAQALGDEEEEAS